jgi:NAD(P)-dependent dehydrogenase (short-subunit alcohol dehydrogenase family)
MKTWLITGASRGIGREVAEQALSRGDRVAATVRRPEALAGLTDEGRLTTFALDVTDTGRLKDVVHQAFARLGRIDVVVSNAGYGLTGPAEEATDEQVHAMIATNLVASVQLARAVTPLLREQGGGHVVQMSSMGGFIGYPGFAYYHATKWGIEGFYESFAAEVAPFGIHTTCVEPGMIQTGFYDSVQRTTPIGAYAGNTTIWRGDTDVAAMPGDQAKVARAILDLADSPSPPRRLLLGSDAYHLVTGAERERLEAFEAQKDLAYSTDRDGFVPPRP